MQGPIVFFDGVCNLCNSSVRLLIKMDRKERLKFSSLQSSFAKELVSKFYESKDLPDSILFFNDGKFHSKSEALIEIFKILDAPFKYFSLFGFLPGLVLDTLYDLVARNRYRVFGKMEECMIPDQKWKNRFIED